ncbi:PhoD-like phosphatase-domain-containing protein [Ganoderma leucocontextum]|nr:PhoD-like phosphatase-domain-containing protein [Ganoderma leucocontextum]
MRILTFLPSPEHGLTSGLIRMIDVVAVILHFTVMFVRLPLSFVLFSALVKIEATRLFDRNLAYSSPFTNAPHLSHNTHSLRARHVQFVKRQQQLDDTISSDKFNDEHYPTFYGGNFSNSPWVYSGGVNFTHNVASGDPFDDSVLLWTRAVPLGTPPDQSIPVCVTFKIFDNADLSGRLLDGGDAFTTYDVDWTLKVEANSLKPDSHYWFQFSDCANPRIVSPIGTTRTIASPNTPAEEVNGGKPLTLAVFSCARYQDGWFNAYGVAAHNTSADLFLHLGDYDDHEVADQAWKAGTADSNDTALGCSFSPSGACFTDRKLAAVRAYHEWMPIRQVDPDDKLRIWRNFRIGKLLDLTMLDTRQYDRDITDLYYNTVIGDIADETSRSLMGAEQEAWFYRTLLESKARGALWRVVGQQIVFTMLEEDGILDVDAWDGYRANRNRLLNHLYSNKISNTIILSGDSHANWVSDLAHPNQTVTYDPTTGDGANGVEFAGTAVSSTSTFGAGISPANADKMSARFVVENTDLQWSEGSYRGFFTLTLDPRQAQATYWAMRNVSNANLDAFASASFVVKAGGVSSAVPPHLTSTPVEKHPQLAPVH